MSLGPAIGVLGLGILARAIFCPSEPEKHRIDSADFKFCPYCGRELEKAGDKQR